MRLVVSVMAVMFATVAYAGDEVLVDIRNGVVFPASRAEELLSQCSRAVPENVSGTWLPNVAQIHELEAALPIAFEKEVARRHLNVPSISGYQRQYGGLVAHGRKIIYVNAFPLHWNVATSSDKTGRFDDLKKMQIGRVCDGGPRYFGVEYDPERKVFSNFAFDGSLS